MFEQIFEAMFMDTEVLYCDTKEDAYATATALVEVYGNSWDYNYYCDYHKADSGSSYFVCRVPWKYQKAFTKKFMAIDTAIEKAS